MEPDYYIIAVRYLNGKKDTCIESVEIFEPSEIRTREKVVFDIDILKKKVKTKVVEGRKFVEGEDVRVIVVEGKKFIRTDGNKTAADNLENLPRF